MKNKFLTVAIICKRDDSSINEPLTKLVNFLEKEGHKVIVDSNNPDDGLNNSNFLNSKNQISNDKLIDLIIVIGGDGTMLSIARQFSPLDIPLIGVNLGRLGFMTDITLDKMLLVIGDIIDGKFITEKRSLLEGFVERNEKELFSGIAFNEIVVSRGGGSEMVELKVEVDNNFMYNQRSDGLIIATPTGSTAYSLSVGGPVMHPELEGIVLAPIAPHTLSNRPIVISDRSKISIELVAGAKCSVSFDMQSEFNLTSNDKVIIEKSLNFVNFLHPNNWSFFEVLRKKLLWYEFPYIKK